MTHFSSPEINRLLIEWNEGDEEALNRLMPLVYDDLHRIARHFLRREQAGHTLQTSALVNEIYLRLQPQKSPNWQDCQHFMAAAARLSRRILVDHWRKRRFRPRLMASVDEAVNKVNPRDVDLVALDDALLTLEKIDTRKARIVDLMYFAGLTIGETAKVMNLSAATVKRDWTAARAFLFSQLSRE
jgi:RNA polymerase sigma factor, TIGR02999 family